MIAYLSYAKAGEMGSGGWASVEKEMSGMALAAGSGPAAVPAAGDWFSQQNGEHAYLFQGAAAGGDAGGTVAGGAEAGGGVVSTAAVAVRRSISSANWYWTRVNSAAN